MLQELVAETGANGWAIASMLFFLLVWLALAVRTWRARPSQMDELARLPLEHDESSPAAGATPRTS